VEDRRREGMEGKRMREVQGLGGEGEEVVGGAGR